MGRLRRTAVVATIAVAGGAVVAAGRSGRVSLRGRVRLPDDAPEDLSGAGYPLRSVRRTARVAGTARVAPPGWEPRPLTRLATWVPTPPRHPVARLGAYAWASPNTAAGLLAGFAAGSRPRVRDGVVLFEDVKGPAGAFLGRRGFAASTWGHVVLCRRSPTTALWAHELVHVRQTERFGPLMAPVYLLLYALYGYTRHPMERAARQAVRVSSTDDLVHPPAPGPPR